jgi:hypothetical protein
MEAIPVGPAQAEGTECLASDEQEIYASNHLEKKHHIWVILLCLALYNIL